MQKHLEMSAIWFPKLSQSFLKFSVISFQSVDLHLPVSPSGAFARDRGSIIREQGPFKSLSAIMLKGHRDGPGVHFYSFLLSENHHPSWPREGQEKWVFEDRVSWIKIISVHITNGLPLKNWWSWVTKAILCTCLYAFQKLCTISFKHEWFGSTPHRVIMIYMILVKDPNLNLHGCHDCILGGG